MRIDESPCKTLPAGYVLHLVKEPVAFLVCRGREHFGMQIYHPMQIPCRHWRKSFVIEINVDNPFQRNPGGEQFPHPKIREICLAGSAHSFDDRRVVPDFGKTSLAANGVGWNAIRVELRHDLTQRFFHDKLSLLTLRAPYTILCIAGSTGLAAITANIILIWRIASAITRTPPPRAPGTGRGRFVQWVSCVAPFLSNVEM